MSPDISVKSRNQSNLLLVCVVILSVSSIFACFYLYFSRPRIAYVRSLELVYGFNGMRQAHAEYKTQTDVWQTNIDTLKSQYQRAVEKYKEHENTMSSGEKEDQEKNIVRLETSMKQYSATVSKEAAERDTKLTKSVLNQINAFVEAYGKKKGYDIVLGAQGNGSVIYAKQEFDITNEVLEAMNKDYQIMPVNSTK